VAGTLHVQIDSLDFLPAFVPGVSATGGRFAGDLNVNGTVGRPRFAGDLRLTNGFANVTQTGVLVRDVEVTARGYPDGRRPIPPVGVGSVDAESPLFRPSATRLPLPTAFRVVPSRRPFFALS